MRSSPGSVIEASAVALVKGGAFMLRRRIVTSLCAALLLSLAAPTAALAQEEPDAISDVTIESSTVDMETGVATVTVSVTCFVDVLVVRVEADLIQSYGSGHLASSYQPGAGSSPCQAGEVLTFPIHHGNQQGRFVAGPAEVSGFVEAIVVCCYSADFARIGPTTVILRPA
jgi:hypothetical protein